LKVTKPSAYNIQRHVYVAQFLSQPRGPATPPNIAVRAEHDKRFEGFIQAAFFGDHQVTAKRSQVEHDVVFGAGFQALKTHTAVDIARQAAREDHPGAAVTGLVAGDAVFGFMSDTHRGISNPQLNR
jgi:hypothetical protein